MTTNKDEGDLAMMTPKPGPATATPTTASPAADTLGPIRPRRRRAAR